MPVYVSDLFTATPAPVNASPASTRTWQWLRGSSAISGATSSTYTAVTADIGSTLSASQLETNFLATTTATSAPTEVVQAFDPIRLFSASEPGVWYDPTDMSTLFQNASAVLPVTAPVTSFGQPVGLMLDKSKGLALGAELVTNGSFASGTGWSAIGSNVAITGGALVITGAANNSGYYQGPAGYSGGIYEITVVVTSISQGAVTATLGLPSPTSANCVNITSPGTHTFRQVNYSTDGFLRVYSVGTATTASIDSVSVKAIQGLHATQSTEASRPLYGIVPVSGRRNLLTQSEAFNEAVWTKQASTISADFAVAPDGSTTADKIVESTATSAHGVRAVTALTSLTNTLSFYAKKAERDIVNVWAFGGNVDTTAVRAAFNLTAETVNIRPGQTATITAVGNGWYRCTVSIIITAAGSPTTHIGPNTADLTQDYTGDGTSGILLWGAQLELGSTPTAYQRVSTDLDVTEAGVASVGYLRFDGSTSWMVTPTITPGTDKVQVFAGVRKLSDAVSYGMVAELSVNSGGNNGSFALMAPYVGATYAFDSKGTIGASAVSGSTFPAPTTNALTALGDISGDTRTLRVNGTQVAQNTGDQGAGDYLAYPLYIGRRGGTTLPFNGHLFPLIVRFGPTLTAARIAATEAWVATKTGGVTL